MNFNSLKKSIETLWEEDKSKWKEKKEDIDKIIDFLDEGTLRVAEKIENKWVVYSWIKKAILMCFSIRSSEHIKAEDLTFYDKIPLKKNFDKRNIRVVPPACVRYGSYVDENVVLMPSYVNIGAYVGRNTMVDTWATVGSCAQVGSNVHISGGVGIGGVLEPIQALPVIIEDDVFLGSRSIIVEGVHIEKEVVIAAGVVLTSSTWIIDVSTPKPIKMKGRVPSRSVVIPGSYPKEFPAGLYHVPCALIIGERKESTNKKTSLNHALRDFNIST